MPVITSTDNVDVLMTRILFWQPHHNRPCTASIRVMGVVALPSVTVSGLFVSHPPTANMNTF